MVGSHAVNSPCVHSETEDACAKCTASVSQTCKTNIVFKEAQRMTGQDNLKKLLLLATCRQNKLAIVYFSSHQNPLCRSQWFCQQTGHHKSKKAQFHSFFPTWKTPQSRNLQRFQLPLQVCNPVSKDPAGGTHRHFLFCGGAGEYVNVFRTGLPPVGVPLVLDDQVLFMDGLQQRRGQRLEVGDGLRCDRQAAALLLQEQLLHCRKNAGNSFTSSTELVEEQINPNTV